MVWSNRATQDQPTLAPSPRLCCASSGARQHSARQPAARLEGEALGVAEVVHHAAGRAHHNVRPLGQRYRLQAGRVWVRISRSQPHK